MPELPSLREMTGCPTHDDDHDAGLRDIVISPGLSLHFYGRTVGLYSDRIEAGRGFAEMPLADLLALAAFLSTAEGRSVLEDATARKAGSSSG